MAKIEVRGAIPSFADAPTYGQNYDRPWYEDAAEIARQGLGGGTADVVTQVGQGLRALSPDDTEFENVGRRMARYGQALQEQYTPDTLGQGVVAETLAKGLRGAVAATPSIAATVAGGPVLGGLVAAGQYGLSSGQDTYDKLRAQGISHEDALQAAIGVGGVQGLGEGIATAATGGLYRAARPAAGAAMNAIAGQALDTRVVVPYAKEVLKQMFIQPSTEVGQDVASSLIERQYGAKPEDLISMAGESAQGGLGMTIWMSLLGIPGAAGRAKKAQIFNYALNDENAPPELKQQAIEAITDMAKEAKVSPEAVATWVAQQNTGAQMQQGQEVDLTTARTPAAAGDVGLRRAAPLADSQFTQPDVQRDLFGQRGGPAPVVGEQLDMFERPVGEPQAPAPAEENLAQGDLFAAPPAEFSGVITADTLKAAGLTPKSAYFRQLVGKNMTDAAQQQQIGELFARLMADKNIAQSTKDAVDNLRMRAFGAAAQQQTMLGPKGGIIAKGAPAGNTQLTEAQLQEQQAKQEAEAQATIAAQRAAAANQEQTPVAEAAPIEPAAPQGPTLAAVPADLSATADEHRQLKQAEAMYGIAETDAERAAAAAIHKRVLDKALARMPAKEQVSPSGEPAGTGLPSAPVAEGLSTTEGTTDGTEAAQTVQAEAQGQEPTPELSAAEQQQLQKLLDESEASDTKNVLPASVTSTGKAVPGKTRINQVALANIRDALVKGKEAASPFAQRVVDALNNFTEAYKKYSDVGGEAMSQRNTFAKGKSAEQYADEKVGAINMQAANVQAALAELGDAVGGNAKDVEAVVKLVKSMVQGKIAAPGKTRSETIKALSKLDTMLSQAWASAKRETFMQEAPDTADVRTGAVRASRELQAKGKLPTLVKVAKEGINAGKDEGTLYGLPAILHYMRKNGTPMERALALALRESITGKPSDLKLVFIKEGTPRFDPKSNTVYLREDESPEVILHESFHAALQSFVYQNPKHPAVVQLKKSLKSVLAYKGELTGKAKEIQSLLQKLVDEKNELDAVLELVSYGTTLNEFRKALQEMKGDPKADKSFLTSVNRAWEAIKQIASRLLGGKRSLANDVLEASLELLDKARLDKTQRVAQGNVLEAAVTSDTKYNPAESSKLALEKYAETPGWSINITRRILEGVAGEGGTLDKAVTAKYDKFVGYVLKEFPGLAKSLRSLSSSFGQTREFIRSTDFYRQTKQAGLIDAENLLQQIALKPEYAVKVIDYLNESWGGRKDSKALASTGREGNLRDMADTLMQQLDEAINDLSVADQRLLRGLKFTDMLLRPESLADLAKKSFGMHGVSAIFKPEDRTEVSLDAFKNFLKFEDGVLRTDRPLYQLFETVDGKRVPYGFIDTEFANAHPELDIERSRVWYFDKMKRGEDKGYSFRTRNISGKDLRDVAKRLGDPKLSAVEREEATSQLNAALMTTVAALSHNAATRSLFGAMAPMGRTEDGTATASTVVFNNVAEINKVFGTKLSDKNLLEAADDESKIAHIRSVAQRSDVWVKLPDTDHYGDLRGKIVSGGVWSQLLDMHDRSPVLMKYESLRTLMSAFKKSKTVYSPATHANNILTNYALMLLHGMSHKSIGNAAGLLWKYEVQPEKLSQQDRELMKAFYKSGAVLGQFTNSEAKSYLAKKLEQNITQSNDKSLLTKLAAWAGYEQAFSEYSTKVKNLGGKADFVASELYAVGDNAFRLAAFMQVAGTLQAKNKGVMTDEILKEAGLAARKMFLDYDVDSRWVRAARETALPFISWSYAVAPLLGRLAITKPWAMINMMAALYAMGAMGDDDEWRKKGPEAVRERSLWGMGPYNMIRIPGLGTDDNPYYYNIGKSIPMLSLFEPPMGEAKLAGIKWFPGALTPSGPYFTLAANVLFNHDPFTGKSIHNETDDHFDKVMKVAKASADIVTPSWASSRFLGKVGDLATGKTGPTGRPKDALFVAQMLGLSLYQFDANETKFYMDKEVRSIRREFQTEMAKIKRDELQRGYPDYEALDEKLGDMRKRLEARIAEIRGEEPPEQ